MSLTEFQSIRDYFSKQAIQRHDVTLGIGDDCAVLTLQNDTQLVVSIDTLVSGVHFPEDTTPENIGYKALAVSLSDLAAMGAEPAWVTLALTLPAMDEDWLKAFCGAFFTLADQYDVQLVGGDTTSGPLTVTTQVHGHVAPNRALRRSGAQAGDLLFVTGTIGEAGLGLRLLQRTLALPATCKQYAEELITRLNRPTPRVGIGKALVGIATSAIDISDGFAADLSHILEMSNVGAAVQVDQLPVNKCFAQVFEQVGGWQQPLSAGDDYELLFTAPQHQRAAVEQIAIENECPVTCVGEIEKSTGMRCIVNGKTLELEQLGYEHFC